MNSKPILICTHLFSGSVGACQRQAADFYITDAKSGTRVLVKAGNNSRMVPLIEESILISTRDNNRELSLTLKKWLDERYLSVGSHLLRLEEG